MRIKQSLLSLGLCLALMTSSFNGLAATTRSDISIGSITGAKIAPVSDNSSTWMQQKPSSSSVSVGQIESLTLPLNIPSNAPIGDLNISIQSDAFNMDLATLFVVIEQNGSLFPFALNAQANGSTVETVVQTDAFVRQKGSQAYLYFSAPRKARGGSITMTVRRPAQTSFGPNVVLSVGDYEISKQGANANPIEMAVGASGLLSVDSIYCISKDNAEVIRILVQDGAIMGLAIKDGDIIAGVEYSLTRKTYINTLTKESVLTKNALVDIFNAFEFSFMKNPNESIWFAAQSPLQLKQTLQFNS